MAACRKNVPLRETAGIRVDDGTMCRMPSPNPGPLWREADCRSPKLEHSCASSLPPRQSPKVSLWTMHPSSFQSPLEVLDPFPSERELFDAHHVREVPRSPGVYIIYDLAGPIYVGRSGEDIRGRLRKHLKGDGNKNIALAKRVGAAGGLTFTYCCLPKSEQVDVERFLIATLGVAQFANLRREGLYEVDVA